MENLLKGEVAVVTGGNDGIGKAIALRLAKGGADLALLGTNEETGFSAVKEIRQTAPHCQVEFYRADASQTDLIEETFNQILKRFGKVDLLVNNAGITRDQLLMRMPEEDWDRVLEVNLKSCFNTCRAVIRPMMKAKKGKIINISSVVGLIGNPGQTNYAASKAGMIGFSKALAKEVASRNILVNCIAPGFFKTKMTALLSEGQREALLKEIPLGRFGEVSEIADLVWFLSTPFCQYMTGQVLAIDGGMV